MKKSLRCRCAVRAELSPFELTPGLPAQQCSACAGAWLELEDYRRWRARAPIPSGGLAPPIAPDGGARPCPACARLMHRVRVGVQPDFRLDRCASCQSVWFDDGEWAALVAAGLSTKLDEILSEGWRRQLQLDSLRQGRDAALRLRHGDACIDELNRFNLWLSRQARRDELLALLSAEGS